MHHRPARASFYGSRSGGSVPPRTSAPCGGYPLLQKMRMPPPRRQQPLCQGSLASCTTGPIRVRPSDRIVPHPRLRKTPPYWMRVIATSGRRVAAGAGAAIRVFSKRQDGRGGGGCLVWHNIHLIAIRKTVPAPEAGMATGDECVTQRAAHVRFRAPEAGLRCCPSPRGGWNAPQATPRPITLAASGCPSSTRDGHFRFHRPSNRSQAATGEHIRTPVSQCKRMLF